MESQRRLATLAAALLAFAACSDDAPPRREASAPSALASAETNAVLTSERFRFRVHDYNWEIGGSTVYDLEAPNHFRTIYPEDRRVDGVIHTDWKRIEVELPAERITEFRRLLVQTRFAQLQESYIDESIEDGAITTFYLLLSQGEQEVYCSNEYPDATMRAMSWLRSQAARLDRSAAEPHEPPPGQGWNCAEEH
ncbi:MAG: hypothetical protein AAF645_11035 [Myxococcota bacterium]